MKREKKQAKTTWNNTVLAELKIHWGNLKVV